MKFAYCAILERYNPLELLELSILAEKEGFDMIASSDHFHPWLHTNAYCSFAWIWITSVAERTSRISVGTCVTAPILRYNPAIVAQAFATLASIHPNRVFLSVGAGEALNEAPIGFQWPDPKTRIEMLEEAVKVIKLLWERKFVSFNGKYYKLRSANLYTKPKEKIPLYVAIGGGTLTTARIAGKYGDGLIATIGALRKHGENIIKTFNKHFENREDKIINPIKAFYMVTSYDEDYDKALQSMRWWAWTVVPNLFKDEIYDPRYIEAKAKEVSDKELTSRQPFIFTDPEQYIKEIEKLKKIGFDCLIVANSSPIPEKLINLFGERIIPYFKL
ncbi:MAG: TIGR03557 family F420-dependent LLM class oxidoreductase [Candidatus Methanomethylicaceae archaeon]